MIKKLLIVGAVFGLAQSALAEETQTLDCIITNVTEVDPQFFGTVAPPAPLVGDEIQLDLAQDVITNLMFTSGRGIPLARFGAVFNKITPTENQYLQIFSGTHQGVLGYYEGSVVATLAPGAENVVVSILKAQRFADEANAAKFVMTMDCTQAQPGETAAL